MTARVVVVCCRRRRMKKKEFFGFDESRERRIFSVGNRSVMEATNVASWKKVKDDYERWKMVTKNHLVGKNLWSVIERPSTLREDDYDQMNAKALNIIRLSCGSNMFDDIRHFKTAKEAWNHLCIYYSSDSLKAKPDIEQGVVYDDNFANRLLYKHVEDGDWTMTEEFIRGNRVDVVSLAPGTGTILHVAAMAGHVNIVEGLMSMPEREVLVKIQDGRGFTAIALAAHFTGNTDVAKCMVERVSEHIRRDMLTIKNIDGVIPLLLAADKGHTEMTRYLHKQTPENMLDERDSVLLLERCIKAEIFDVALKLLESNFDGLPAESLSVVVSGALHALAQMPSVFLSGCQFGLAERIIYNSRFSIPSALNFSALNFSALNFLLQPVKLLGGFVFEIWELRDTHYQVQEILRNLQIMVARLNHSQLIEASVYDAMLDAAKHGIVEFIKAMMEANHELLWALDSHKRGVFSYAVLNRKQNVLQLIHTLNGRKDIIKCLKDKFGNNLLHLAGHLGPSSELNRTTGAALQMQREFAWFKAVEKIVHPKCREEKNGDDKKPHELFTETHEELVKDGEKWAKQSASSFSIVGTLITTIMFAAAFTLPGGNNSATGVPIFLNHKRFTVFLIADAISLFTSATSVMIFIWILTSRFAERDFLRSLPLKLLSGLVFLFFSVLSMMVSFCAALDIILKAYRAYSHLIIGATICGSIPVMALVISQISLICDIFQSRWQI